MRRTVAAFATAALLAVGCESAGVSVNAGACGAAVQASTSAIAAARAASDGREAETQRHLDDVMEQAQLAARSTTGPAGDAARELAAIAERINDKDELSGDDAIEALKVAAERTLDLCRS